LKEFAKLLGRDRLVGLALLNVHRLYNILVENIINRFASTKKRNIDFIL